MHYEVEDEGDPEIEVPPVGRHGERKPYWLATAPVEDPRHEHVQGNEEEQQVRNGEADGPVSGTFAVAERGELFATGSSSPAP